jgi:general secretion pathway protein J
MMLHRGVSGQQTGFTLLEILVVLVVLGFLVVGLTRGVRTGLTLWDAQTRRIGETAELDAGARVLRTLLSAMWVPPPRLLDPEAAHAPESAGQPDRLTFIGNLPTGLGTTRRANITLELRDRRLVLRWTPHRHELTNTPAPEPIQTELIRGVERLDLAYWGSSSTNQPAVWQAQWDSYDPPGLIRVRLGFAKGDRRRWPDLIAAPQR